MRCLCVADHNPNPMRFHVHHKIPRSWGGSDEPENLVVLCPTTHNNVHKLLNEYVRIDAIPSWEIRSRYGSLARSLARHAWNNRPPTPNYTFRTLGPVAIEDCYLEDPTS